MSSNQTANSYRKIAQQHFRKCKILLEENSGDAYRYACLELRMAIEALTYGLMAIYRPELDQLALRKWQPAKLLRELLNIDPSVENPPIFSIQNPEDGTWNQVLEKEKRLSAKWLNKAHNALSSFLHVQMTDPRLGSEECITVAKTKLGEYCSELETALSSRSWNTMFRDESWSYPCECGNSIVRRKKHVGLDYVFKCTECPRQYDSFTEDGQIRLKLKQIIWKCNLCEADNAFPEYQLTERYLVKCRSCSEPAQIRKEWLFFQKDAQSPPTENDAS